MTPLLVFIISIFCLAAFAALWRPKFNPPIVVVCAITSGVLGWYFFSLHVEEIMVEFFPPEPFASVETIMRETNYQLLLIQTFQSFGWSIGILYFWIIFGICYSLRAKIKKQPITLDRIS